MTYPAIHAYLRARCPQADVTLGDFDYVLPANEWVLGDFLPSWREKCIDEDLRYIPGKFDCENFAQKCAVHARDCHRKTPGNTGKGILFGDFWFTDSQIGPHGINCWITTDANGELEMRFMEPQPVAHQVFLTDYEIRSCTEISFS